jgi:DNA-binding XRE family transcriptional regulator
MALLFITKTDAMSTIVDISPGYSGNDVGVTTSTKRKLGARVRDLRKRKGWSQTEMADLLVISRVYLSELETGKRDPSLTVLKILADGLSITLSKLLEGL